MKKTPIEIRIQLTERKIINLLKGKTIIIKGLNLASIPMHISLKIKEKKR